jgi:hypothetical protein
MTDDEGLGLGIKPDVDLLAATVLHFDDPTGWQQLIPADERSGAGLEDGPCHIISAIHSHQVIGDGEGIFRNGSIPEIFNARRQIDLRNELTRRGSWVGEAVGVAPELSYGELSVAVGGLTREEAVDIGRRFRQVAIFEVDYQTVKVAGCLVEGVLSQRPYALRYLGDQRPCPMRGGLDSDSGYRCGPPAVRAAGQARDVRRWKERWWRAYGLLGCDVCRGEMGR